MITPIRGRKPIALSLIIYNLLSLKDDNPDKGTETQTLAPWWRDTFCKLKDDNPDKGTETTRWRQRNHLLFFLLKDDNPDQGTETIYGL